MTVLKLRHDEFDGKYYIASQDDLYQVNEFVKFFWPGGFLFVWLWQMCATLACLALAVAFWPVSWFEEHAHEILHRETRKVENPEKDAFTAVGNARGGSLVTAPAIQQR